MRFQVWIPPIFKTCANECVLDAAHMFCIARNFLNKIRPCRRIATRYDKLATNYLAYEFTAWADFAPRGAVDCGGPAYDRSDPRVRLHGATNLKAHDRPALMGGRCEL